MVPRYDVVVAGAGPAGAMTALLLAAQRPRLRILLAEAEHAPRHRPCGEYLSPGARRVLARAGVEDAVLATGAHPLAGVAITGPRGGPDVRFAPVAGFAPWREHGLGVRRERFDRALQDAAAGRCDLVRGLRLRALARDGDGWSLTLAGGDGERIVSGALLIGADGRHSLVRRRAGLDRPLGRRRFALVCRARGVLHRDRVEMHLGPLGQIGVAPLGGGEVNLNLLLAPASAALLRRRAPADLLRLALAATPTLAARCRRIETGPVLTTGSLPQACRSVVGEGLCLVGDAAGFCDPFTGEGMSLALRGAESLADALAGMDLSRAPSADALAGYARAHAGGIGRRHRWGEALQGALARRAVADAVAGLLGQARLLARLVIADAAGYRRAP